MTLGQKVKQLRAQYSFSQPELAEKIGIEQSYLSKLENDKSLPSNDIFKQILRAFDISLSEFLADFTPGAELDRLKGIPDVQHFLQQQSTQQSSKQRRYLWISSALIVIATTVFYIGFLAKVFPELQYQYQSLGVLQAGESTDTLRRWQNFLSVKQRTDREFMHQQFLQIESRKDPKIILDYTYQGSAFNVPDKDGFRHYVKEDQRLVPRPINQWLQALGVLLFSCGIMGFVLEKKLFQRKFS